MSSENEELSVLERRGLGLIPTGEPVSRVERPARVEAYLNDRRETVEQAGTTNVSAIAGRVADARREGGTR